MKKLSNVLAEIIYAAGGKIVGKIRMQKVVYLLEQLGLGADVDFSYYHYGPYSEQVSSALDYAEIIDGSVVESLTETSAGYRYSTYALNGLKSATAVGNLPLDRAKQLIARMTSDTSVVIELAATINWLKSKERVTDWRVELLRRKPGKATTSNIDSALRLLRDVGLDG